MQITHAMQFFCKHIYEIYSRVTNSQPNIAIQEIYQYNYLKIAFCSMKQNENI